MSSVAPVGANGRVRGGRVDTSAAAIVGYRDDVKRSDTAVNVKMMSCSLLSCRWD